MTVKSQHMAKYITGLATLTGLSLSAHFLMSRSIENDQKNRAPTVTNIPASETSDARHKLLAKFPLLAQKLKGLQINTTAPHETTRFTQTTHIKDTEYKTVKLDDTFTTSCSNLQAEWAKQFKSLFLDKSDDRTFLYLADNWTPLHDAEDKNSTYVAMYRANSFTLSRSDKSGKDNHSYSLTLACN